MQESISMASIKSTEIYPSPETQAFIGELVIVENFPLLLANELSVGDGQNRYWLGEYHMSHL